MRVHVPPPPPPTHLRRAHAVAGQVTCKECGRRFAPRKWQVACDGCLAIRERPAHHRRPRKPSKYMDRPCKSCAECYTPTGAASRYCPTCLERRKPSYARRRILKTPRLCRQCGSEFAPIGKNNQYCGDQCQREHNRQKYLTWWASHGRHYQVVWYRQRGKALRQAAKANPAPNPCWPSSPGDTCVTVAVAS